MSNELATIKRRGLMLVLSSPSGAGKTTISRALLEGDENLVLSVSVTTRPKRPGETDGVDYSFVGQAEFDALAEGGALLERAVVFGHCYGTPRAPVEAALAAGRDVLFDIDWQGAQQLVENARDDLVTVFILPPSTGELARRLHSRAQDSEAEIAKRMAKSVDEMSHFAEYDFIVVNREIEKSVGAVQGIIASERLRRARQVGLVEFVKGLGGEG